jgi:hypothetical protein
LGLGWRPLGQFLKVVENINFVAVEAVLDQLLANELAWCQEPIHAFGVSAQQPVKVSLGSQNQRGSRPPLVTARGHHMPEPSARATITVAAMSDQVVARANDLEIVQVIEDGNALRMQFPKDRRGEMVIDVAHVRDVRPECRQDPAQFSSHLV